MGSKHTSFPKSKNQTPLTVCPWKRQLARSVLGRKNSIRGGTRFAIIPFKRPEIAFKMTLESKHTSFVKLKNQTSPKVWPWKRQLARSVLREKNSIRGGTHYNNPPRMSFYRVIIWSFGNLIACRMTLESKHTSFPKLKNQTSPKVWPWKRQPARSVVREKNFIRGVTHFVIIPFKRSETV